MNFEGEVMYIVVPKRTDRPSQFTDLISCQFHNEISTSFDFKSRHNNYNRTKYLSTPPGRNSVSSSSSGASGFHFINSSPFGDTTYTKLFVGGLAWETQSDTMGRYFEQFGQILEAVVISDKNTGRSKGYGFVTFQEPEAAARACADPTPVIDGRRANCNLASLRRPRLPMSYGSAFRNSFFVFSHS
ncbi:hypothetical protein ACLB2K_057352 [Fragaria x ananassa]